MTRGDRLRQRNQAATASRDQAHAHAELPFPMPMSSAHLHRPDRPPRSGLREHPAASIICDSRPASPLDGPARSRATGDTPFERRLHPYLAVVTLPRRPAPADRRSELSPRRLSRSSHSATGARLRSAASFCWAGCPGERREPSRPREFSRMLPVVGQRNLVRRRLRRGPEPLVHVALDPQVPETKGAFSRSLWHRGPRQRLLVERPTREPRLICARRRSRAPDSGSGAAYRSTSPSISSRSIKADQAPQPASLLTSGRRLPRRARPTASPLPFRPRAITRSTTSARSGTGHREPASTRVR